MASGIDLHGRPEPPQLHWRLGNVFGEAGCSVEEVQEADILSSVQFDPTGKYLATGDKGGRVVLFQRENSDEISSDELQEEKTSDSAVEGKSASNAGEDTSRDIYSPALYTFYAEFQSHEAEFDYLKSVDIEEKINQICWCNSYNDALFLLTTNDKTVKLWKVHEKQIHNVGSFNIDRTRFGGRPPIKQLRLPYSTATTSTVVAVPRRTFANAHAYHINSISVNSDGMTFLSADDLRINMWSLEDNSCSYNVVDIKPQVMEMLTEVITCATFHPRHCNVLAYSNSRGSIKLCDMRTRAASDTSKVYRLPQDSDCNYLSEITASISDFKISQDGMHIFARDYGNVNLWDVRMENQPVSTVPVHDFLGPKLFQLYESDCIFDKFEVSISPDGGHFITGTYGDRFCVYDSAGMTLTTLELSQVGPVGPAMRANAPVSDPELLDYNRKVLHASWNPESDCVAVAGLNNLFIYNAERRGGRCELMGNYGSAAPHSRYTRGTHHDHYGSSDAAVADGDPFAAFKPEHAQIAQEYAAKHPDLYTYSSDIPGVTDGAMHSSQPM